MKDHARTGSTWLDIDGRRWQVLRRWIGAGRFTMVTIRTGDREPVHISEARLFDKFEPVP